MDDTQVMFMEMAGKGYSCAQMVLLGGLRLIGRENPDLTRAMAGLAQGVGCSGGMCGALGGAVCLVALHTGKGLDYEDAHPESIPIMIELMDWFKQENGATDCDSILESHVTENGCRAMNPSLCGGLVVSAWTKAVSLLAEKGIDPTMGRDEV